MKPNPHYRLLWLLRQLSSLPRCGLLLVSFSVPQARAQWAVFDVEAVAQLTHQVNQGAQQIQTLTNQYNQMKAMAVQAQGLWRYRGPQSIWQYFKYADQYASVADWALGVNSAAGNAADNGYNANIVLARVDDTLSNINDGMASSRRTLSATRAIMDGNNTAAIAAIGSIRAASADYQNAIAELQHDAENADAGVQSQLAVEQRTNAAAILQLRTSQYQLRLLTSMLENQVADSKLIRDTLAADNNAALDLQDASKDTSLWNGATESLRNWNIFRK